MNALRHGEPENAAVEAESTLEVGDLQMDVADANGRIERRIWFGRLHATSRVGFV